MTVLNGTLSPRSLHGVSGIITGDLAKYTAAFVIGGVIMSPALFGTKSANGTGSAPPRLVLGGTVGRSFGNELFEKIIVVPRTKNVGSIFADTTFQIEVWNSTRRAPPRSMTAITVLGGGGLSVANPYGLPLAFGSMQSRMFTATVVKDGASTIVDKATFVFTGFAGTSTDVAVTGTRGIFLMGSANWRQRIRETISYLTGIMQAVVGNEQRQRFLRNPRRSYDYLITPGSPREGATIRSVIYGAQVKKILAPEWTEQVRLGTALSIGDSVVVVPTTDRDFFNGGTAVLYGGFNNYEIVEIGVVTSGQFTLARPTAKAWPAHTTVVVPARYARMSQSISGDQHTSRVTELQVSVDIDPINSPLFAGSYPYPYTHMTHGVFLERNNDVDLQKKKMERNTTVLDNKSSLFNYVQWATFPFIGPEISLLPKTRAEITRLRKFLEDRSGRFMPFWMPSWNADLELATSFGSSSTTIVVRELGLARYVGVNEALRDLAFIKRDGTMTFHRIVGAVSNGDDTETITLAAPIGYGAVPADFSMICFLHFCRQAEDETVLEWASGAAVIVRIPLRLLKSPDS